jgi:hypothetical protein
MRRASLASRQSTTTKSLLLWAVCALGVCNSRLACETCKNKSQPVVGARHGERPPRPADEVLAQQDGCRAGDVVRWVPVGDTWLKAIP